MLRSCTKRNRHLDIDSNDIGTADPGRPKMTSLTNAQMSPRVFYFILINTYITSNFYSHIFECITSNDLISF